MAPTSFIVEEFIMSLCIVTSYEDVCPGYKILLISLIFLVNAKADSFF